MKTEIKCAGFRDVRDSELNTVDGGVNPLLVVIGIAVGEWAGSKLLDGIYDELTDGPGIVDIVKAAQSGKPLRG